MKEHIEEMEMTPLDFLANDINQHCPDIKENYCGDTHCVACLATALYNADYRKQKEGEWIDRYNGDFANPIYVCSVCGKGTLLKPYIDELGNMEMIQALSAFCPNCGAKMKGGAE